MSTSCLPGCLQWLNDAAKVGVTTDRGGRIGPITATALAAPVGGQVIVFDGPELSFDQTVYSQQVWVGHDPVNAAPAATSTQEFAAINQARSRYEEFEIVCACSDWSGDTTMKVHRDAVFALMAQFEGFLRGIGAQPGDATMGGNCLYAQVAGPTDLYYDQDAEGATATVVFHITGKARLTT